MYKFFCVSRRYCSQIPDEIFPYSTIKIIKKNKVQESEQIKHNNQNEYRENEIKIQMLSKNLFKQIFGNEENITSVSLKIEECLTQLKSHNLKIGESPHLDDVQLKLPPLKGSNIEEHFFNIAHEQSEPYKKLIETILGNLPSRPKSWSFTQGWTKYEGTKAFSVEYPEESALVFDVEVCVPEGKKPVIACAVGKNWYSWVSSTLIAQTDKDTDREKNYYLDDMIQLEPRQFISDLKQGTEKPRIVVGHNVSYDRARVREQYYLSETKTRFLDTMSLHVCVSGITSYQRAMLKSNQVGDEENLDWQSLSSLNSLSEVFRLYCGGELKKEPRDIFVKGTIQDVRDDFQNLMTYCSNDVAATQNVLIKLFPLFLERFPHPASLAGMLEIGSAYLPVNSNWNRYIEEANLTYEDLDIESKYQLARRADEACRLLHNKQYKNDLWMWDQDWSIQPIKLKKKTTRKKNSSDNDNITGSSDYLTNKFSYLYETKSLLPARRPLLPGYPAWYRKLCIKPELENWHPGPFNISSGMQIVPKLLSLCWEGYPLHYLKEQGWGFLVPFKEEHPDPENGLIPLAELVKKCPVIDTFNKDGTSGGFNAMESLHKDVETNISKKDYWKKPRKKVVPKPTESGVWCSTTIEDCCWFFKLPHKDGVSHRVGNPLAKDFLNKFSESVLTGHASSAQRVIEIAKMLSYWRNNRDRITNQLVVWLSTDCLPNHLQDFDIKYGAIIPQVVVCGTLTRRAMEATWMTASNAYKDRVGSELRSMIQAPKGYKIVGADVDSQELWIASILGDAYAYGIHGGAPLGWMTLSGTKANGTDMHSVTAKAVGISRDHAKIINYARIYGAGQNFAERLLKQFNPQLSDGDAKSKAMKMFALTKGKRKYYLRPEYKENYINKGFSAYEALKVASANGKSVPDMFQQGRWEGGTESAMFNRLESIAAESSPITPFLSSRLSRALEPSPGSEDRFLPTRVNWVVQSGAVDFLHLMLVCMRWLMGPRIKFCLSFHDEVRYLVKDEFAYKAALAMHVTNLLTRSFCAKRVGLNDLPQAVAFFTSVEIDTVLRKESSVDCQTPSNPHGLEAGYGIPKGQSLDIYEVLKQLNCNDLTKWEWHNETKNNN